MNGRVDLPALFAFEDMAGSGDELALRLCIGPSSTHRTLTFDQLRGEVLARARVLDQQGCRQGDRVALLMPQGAPLIAAFYAAIYLGCLPSIIAWPTAKMDAQKYRRNLLGVLQGLAADCLVTDANTTRTLDSVLGRTRVLDASSAPAGGSAPPPRLRGDGPAFIQFSGGTTGTQKSVPISFEQLRRQLESLSSVLKLDKGDHIISWLPLYHDMGLIASLLMPFVMRLPTTMFAPMEWVMDPRPFLQAIGDHRATLCWQPNFAFSFLASRVSPTTTLDLSSMRAFVNCSEPVRSESFDAFLEKFCPYGLSPGALHASYAMAEATFAVTQTTANDPPRRLEVSRDAFTSGRLVQLPAGGRVVTSSGPAIPGIHIRIVDKNGDPSAPDEIGEIWLRSPFMMEDYLDAPRDPNGSRAAFTDGYYRSGDLGALVDGHLYVTGRKKDVIIVGGVNIYPEDLESAVGDIGGVHAGRVVALGIEAGDVGTERLVVVAEVDTEEHLAQARALEIEIRNSVVAVCGLAPYRVLLVPPKWIVKSTAGKISRSETRARILERFSNVIGGGERSTGHVSN